MKPTIRIKRAYEKSLKKDGHRTLVDRLWPRGLKKEEADINSWAKSLAPSPALRKWFGHDPEKWDEFRKKYLAELKKNPAVAEFVQEHDKEKLLTLIYAAKDVKHTHAIILQEFLEQQFDAD